MNPNRENVCCLSLPLSRIQIKLKLENFLVIAQGLLLIFRGNPEDLPDLRKLFLAFHTEP